MTADVTGVIGAAKIGRYFTVVSALPATIFVLYVYALVRTDPWTGPMQWSQITDATLKDIGILGIIALVLALAMNPLQVRIIQMFEGYWGTSAPAMKMATIRTAHHRRLRRQLKIEELTASAELGDSQQRVLRSGNAPDLDIRRALLIAGNQRAAANYPLLAGDILPTRLGNILRRYEKSVGAPYGLNALVAIPRLAMVAGEREVAYVENQRIQLELALRTAFLALLASPITVLMLWRQGAWLLLSLAPYMVAFFAYRGSLAIAHEYGTSLGVLTDLSRFDLYDRLRLTRPKNTHDELETNEIVMKFFHFQTGSSVSYLHPPLKEADTEQPAPPTEPPDIE